MAKMTYSVDVSKSRKRLYRGNETYAEKARLRKLRMPVLYDAIVVVCGDSRMRARFPIPKSDKDPRLLIIPMAGNALVGGQEQLESDDFDASFTLVSSVLGTSIYVPEDLIVVGHSSCGFVAAQKALQQDPAALDAEPATIRRFVTSHAGKYEHPLRDSPHCDETNAAIQSRDLAEVAAPYDSESPHVQLYSTPLLLHLDCSKPHLNPLRFASINDESPLQSRDVALVLASAFNDAVLGETLVNNSKIPEQFDLSSQKAHVVVLYDPRRLPMDPGTIFQVGPNEMFMGPVFVRSGGETQTEVLMDVNMLGNADYPHGYVTGIKGERGNHHVLALDYDPAVAAEILRVYRAQSAFGDQIVGSVGTYNMRTHDVTLPQD